MSLQIWKIVKVARKVARTNPLLGYELERCAVAVINPEAKSFGQTLEGTVAVLKSLKQELEGALQKLEEGEWDQDTAEFAKFFDDAAEAEAEELRQMLKRVSSTAGVKDFFKGLFKGKKKKPADEDDESTIKPSYQMDDSTMDEFVEGKKDWADPGHYVGEEVKEQKEFFGGVDKVVKDVEKARKEPSKSLVQGLLKEIGKLVRHGENMMKGVRKHLLEPGVKAEITEEGLKEKEPSKKEKPSPEKLESTVAYYADLLKDTLGDEGKTIKLLKELFHAVGPAVEEERASLASRRTFASALIRIAHANPELRPRLLPVIRRVAILRPLPPGMHEGYGKCPVCGHPSSTVDDKGEQLPCFDCQKKQRKQQTSAG